MFIVKHPHGTPKAAGPACVECFASEPTVGHASSGHTNSGGTNSYTTTHHRYTEATNTWDTRTFEGTSLWLLAGAHFDGKGYQTGGGPSLADTRLGSTTHSEFSFGGNSWTSRAASLANQCRHLCTAAHDGGGYYTRGGLNSTTVGQHYYFRFDTSLTWTDRSVGPTTNQGFDHNGWTAIGDNSRFLYWMSGSFTTSATVGRRQFRYDQGGPSVLERAAAPLPDRRQAFCYWNQGCQVNIDKANCIGGMTTTTDLADNDEYDVPANAWTSRTNKTTAVRAGVAHRINGDIYYMGGNKVAPVYSVSTSERYDPPTTSWASRAAMPIAAAWRAQFGI